MTKRQIENKISALDYWLTTNATHDNYSIVLQDKKDLELILKQMINEE